MTNIEPKTITATALKVKTSDALRQVGVDGIHLIIERNKFPIAVLIPIADYKALLEDKKRVEQSLQHSTTAETP